MSEVKISLRQARAAKVAEFAFQQRLERIRWEEEVLIPYLEGLKDQLALEGIIPVFDNPDARD